VFLGETLGKVVKLEAQHSRPDVRCTRLQTLPRRARKVSPLTPALKEFIDHAIVPALVKQYLAEDELANRREDAANSPRLKIVKP
jgi:hypothetical protein